MTSLSAHCIVLEHSRIWASALRRLAGFEQVEETRHWSAVEAALRIAPASAVVSEVIGGSVVDVARLGWRIQERFPRARWFAVGDAQIWNWELTLRQAGAVDLTDSPRSLERLGRCLRRHFEMYPSTQPTLRDELWQRLPH